MAISFVNQWSSTNTSGVLSIATAVGTQAQIGDVMVAEVAFYGDPGGSVVITAPADWTIIVPNFFDNPVKTIKVVYYKVVGPGDIGQTFVFSTSMRPGLGSGGIMAWRGVNNVVPISGAGTGTGEFAPISTAVTAGSIDVGVAGSVLIWMAGIDQAYPAAVTVPPGFTPIWNILGVVSGNVGDIAAFQLDVAAGATGDITGTASFPVYYAGVLIALAPGSAPAPGLAIPYEIQSPGDMPDTGAEFTGQRLYITINANVSNVPQALTPTLIIDGVENTLPQITNNGRTTIEIPIAKFHGRLFDGVRLTGSLTGRVEVFRVEADVWLGEQNPPS